jgi:hypothetical protein
MRIQKVDARLAMILASISLRESDDRSIRLRAMVGPSRGWYPRNGIQRGLSREIGGDAFSRRRDGSKHPIHAAIRSKDIYIDMNYTK